MGKSWLAGLGLLSAFCFVPRADAADQAATAWLHVRVEEQNKPSKVSVNLPLTVVEAALQSMPEIIEAHKGELKLGAQHGMKVSDLRRVWKQIVAAGDADFVTVDSEQDQVRIGRKGDFVQIFASQKPATRPAAEAVKPETGKPVKPLRHAGEVQVEVPIQVVDALLSGQGEELNIPAGVAELQKRRGDIVRVHDPNSTVRVWVDEQNVPAGTR